MATHNALTLRNPQIVTELKNKWKYGRVCYEYCGNFVMWPTNLALFFIPVA
jgi:hypothetical protein